MNKNLTMSVRSVTLQQMEELIRSRGIPVPVEQSQVWGDIERSTAGRQPWHQVVVSCDGKDVAACALIRYQGRMLVQIAAKHGPVWLDGTKPSLDLERRVIQAVEEYVRHHEPNAALLRLHLWNSWEGLQRPIIRTIWDRTVILDITGSDDDLMSRMSKSGRRFVRLAARNEDITTQDDTGVDYETFEREIFPVFAETADRNDFILRSARNYYTMLEHLRPNHGRLITGRLHGKVVCWALYTVYDGVGTYLFAASNKEARKNHVVFSMMWCGIHELAACGVTALDLYGVSSERTPEMESLDQFKFKWSGGKSDEVAGAWDIILRPATMRFYHVYTKARQLPQKVKALFKR